MTFLMALRRDVRTVANDLFGQRPQPFAIRTALSRHHHVILGSAGFAPRPTTVRKLTRETRDAVTLELDAELDFHAGQFLTLIVNIDGTEHRRAYSISTAPHDGRVAVTVKRMGLVSSYLCERAREGERLQLLGPSGSFGVTPGERARHVVLIGGGSGITPLFSIARTILHSEPQSRVTLFFGNRTEADIIFRDALAAIDDPRFTVKHLLGERLELPELPADGEFYVCGPEPMMAATRQALLAAGIDAAQIHEEKFTSPTQRKSRLPVAPQPIRVGDKTVTAQPGQTILEAALAANVSLPFSCTMGGCGACKVRVVDGEVDMDEPSCLTAAERAEGYVLSCVGRAESPVTIEVPS